MRPDEDDDLADVSDSQASLLRALAHAPEVPLAALAPPLAPGARVDEFEIVAVLGAGGMGVVYRARDTLLEREVALKLLHPSWQGLGENADALLEREARATAKLRHPNLVTIHRVGRSDGRLYLVLELLEGESLASRLRRGKLGEAEAIATMLAITDALAHAHAHGIVHRDLKPGNVFLEAGRGVKLLDFGLAGASAAPASGAEPRDATAPARTLIGAGTPGYMAPEQWRGEPVDLRTDVFAAGALLDELLTGTRQVTDAALATAARPTPRARGLRITPELDRAIARATAPARDDRFPDVAALAAALRAARSTATRRKHARRLLRAAAALLLLVLATGLLVREARRRPPPVDLSGAWQADPTGWGHATLTRVDARHYRWEHKNREQWTEDTFYNRGELTLENRDGHWILSGRLQDVPGWCCGHVGYMELEVMNDQQLHVVKSVWGTTHEDYGNTMPSYDFRRPR